MTPAELRRALRAVVADYEAFLARAPAPGGHEDAKAFAAHHAAARGALSHLEHLLKINRGGAEAEAEAAAEAGALIAEARRSIRLAETEDREGERSDDDDDADTDDAGRDDGA